MQSIMQNKSLFNTFVHSVISYTSLNVQIKERVGKLMDQAIDKHA